MTVRHDDLPHPVPPFAYLRWKENWFFIIMDAEHDVHGVVHLNYEPGLRAGEIFLPLERAGPDPQIYERIAFSGALRLVPRNRRWTHAAHLSRAAYALQARARYGRDVF